MLARIDVKDLEGRIIRVHVFGKLDRESAPMLMDALESRVAGHPYCLFLSVLTDISGLSADVRRTVVHRLRSFPPRIIALVGGGFAQRVTAKLVLAAMAVLEPQERTMGAFFVDEDEALRWLRQRAAERDAARGAGS